MSVVGTNPSQNQPRQPISVQDLAVWQERQTSFEKFGAYGFAPMNLSTEEGRPERFSGGQLTVAAFEALGVQPMLGRGFREGDDRPGAEPVVLLGYDLWRDRYRQLAGHRRQDHPRQRRAAHRHRRHAGEVRASRSGKRCGCRSRSIRSPRREARAQPIRSSRG